MKELHLPAEDQLELYDVVVYEINGVQMIHRIVGIEEANEKHPEERLFQLQGDAVATPDKDPVRYEQMKGIYRGKRIPNVGSFVMFMQSPAGWLCIILILAYLVCEPIIGAILRKEQQARYDVICGKESDGEGKEKRSDVSEKENL